MAYKHGTYGELTASKVKGTASADTVVVYVGTAPVNLVRGVETSELVNKPIKILNMIDAQGKSATLTTGTPSVYVKRSHSTLTTQSATSDRFTSSMCLILQDTERKQ